MQSFPPLPWKRSPTLFQQAPSKNWGPFKTPFLKFGWRFTPPPLPSPHPPSERVVHTMQVLRTIPAGCLKNWRPKSRLKTIMIKTDSLFLVSWFLTVSPRGLFNKPLHQFLSNWDIRWRWKSYSKSVKVKTRKLRKKKHQRSKILRTPKPDTYFFKTRSNAINLSRSSEFIVRF